MTDKHPSRGFFAVDRRAWARVCSLGINPAVAYLVLACGSGRDNRTTRWSDHAIQKHTGISRGRTDKAMAELKTIGLIREDKGGKYPRYYIMPAQDVPGCEGYSVKRADPHSVPGANGGSTKKKAEPKADCEPARLDLAPQYDCYRGSKRDSARSIVEGGARPRRPETIRKPLSLSRAGGGRRHTLAEDSS